MITTWSLLRLVKFAGVALFAAGVFGAASLPGRAARLRAAWGPGFWGFLIAWGSGFLLMKTGARTLGEPWILAGMACSAAALHGAMLCAHRPAPRPLAAGLALAGLFAGIGVMAIRSASWPILAIPLVAGALLGALVRSLWIPPNPAPDADPAAVTAARDALLRLARVEGLSLLLLLFVATPLRRLTGISLDLGTGLLGWTHGVLLIAWIAVLPAAAPALAWGGARIAEGAFLALLPFGTFLFERRVASLPLPAPDALSGAAQEPPEGPPMPMA